MKIEDKDWLYHFDRYLYRGSKTSLEKICDNPEKVERLMNERAFDQSRKREDMWSKNIRAGKYDSVSDKSYISAITGYCPRCETDENGCICRKSKTTYRPYELKDYTRSPFSETDVYVEEGECIENEECRERSALGTQDYPDLTLAIGYVDQPTHRLHGFLVKILEYRGLTNQYLCQVLRGPVPIDTRNHEFAKIYLSPNEIKAKDLKKPTDI